MFDVFDQKVSAQVQAPAIYNYVSHLQKMRRQQKNPICSDAHSLGLGPIPLLEGKKKDLTDRRTGERSAVGPSRMRP